MLLFGIYFPERWRWDEKLPWLKWIFIIPLGFQIVLTLFSILLAFTGINLFRFLGPVPAFYGKFAYLVNMIAIGMFFAALGYKSGTTKNPDARRRLKVMLYGTSLAITPSFLIVIYRVISGVLDRPDCADPYAAFPADDGIRYRCLQGYGCSRCFKAGAAVCSRARWGTHYPNTIAVQYRDTRLVVDQ